MWFAPQWRALFRHPNLQKWREHVVFCTFWLGNVLRATTACTFSTSQLPKVVRPWCVLYILTWKCASRHNGVHFFDISTSKSGPTMVCFVHFDFKMCFAPQRRALFRHLNFQKWSEPLVFCTFWLGNVLGATTARAFSTSQLPKAVRTWGVLYLLTWKCASRHNGVQFFIAPVTSWLRTRRFSEPTFRPSWATNHWKNTVFRDFPTFSRICIFFLLTLSLLLFFLLIFLFSLPLPCSAFHLSILLEVWLLNFLRIWFEHATKHQTCKPHSTKIRPGRVLTNVRTLPRQVPTTQGTDDILHYLAVLLSASRCVSFQKTSRLCQQHLWWECHSLSPEAPEICDI